MFRTLLFVLLFTVAACPSPEGSKGSTDTGPERPSTGDTTPVPPRSEGTVYIDSASIAGGRLHVAGNLPTPCHQLAWNQSRSGTTITVRLFSTYDPEVICAQMLKPFTVEITLNGYAQGDEVVLNEAAVK